MKLQQLRYFIAVYEEGSITAGADRTHATQSGLSMQLKDLEERFGGELFERVTKGVRPTEMGRRFYEHAIKILKEVAEAEQDMNALRGIVSGHIKVGLMPTFTRSVFPPTLLAFNEQYPLVSVSVVEAYSGQLTSDVLRGALDFAIVPKSREALQPGLSGYPIGQDSEFLVSRMESSKDHMQPVRLVDVPNLKLVLPGSQNARRPNIDSYLKRNKIKVSAVLELDAMMGTLELVAQSDWCTILPGALCIPDVPPGARCLNPLTDAPPTEYIMIQEKSGRLSKGAQLFADIVQEEFVRQVH